MTENSRCEEYVVAVTGGRNYLDGGRVFEVLDEIDSRRHIDVLVHGGASGADYWAARWAGRRSRQCVEFKADWAAYGKAAGPIRNGKILDEAKPDLLVAFPGGRGTANMTKQARERGVPVVICSEQG